MSFLDEIPLIPYEALLNQLKETNPEMGKLLEESHHADAEARSKFVREWEQWCKAQTKRVRAVEADVPDGILPRRFKGTLTDIKVGKLFLVSWRVAPSFL